MKLPDPSPGPLRILILEAEIYATDPQARLAAESGLLRGFFPQGADPAAGVAGGPELGYRIAFADAIELP